MGPGSCGRHQGRDRIQIWPGRQACHRQEFEGEIYQLSVRRFCARPDLWLLLFRGTSTSNLRKSTLRPRAFKASTEGCSADRRSLPNSFLNPSSRRTSRSAEASATLVCRSEPKTKGLQARTSLVYGSKTFCFRLCYSVTDCRYSSQRTVAVIGAPARDGS